MAGIVEGRVVIVTGAGGGLGRAHALAFAKEGAKVVVNDLGGAEGPAGEVVKEIKAAGGEAFANGADVSNWEETGALVQSAIDTFGDIHVVVNNAGNLRDRMFVSSSPEDWDAVMAVHLRGHYNIAKHAATHWRAQSKEGKDVSGRIINTTSGAGLNGSIAQSNYSAAKAGIAALTLVQAAELGRYGITANAIAPIARTQMTEKLFADTMAKPGEGEFDEHAPGNVSPLLVWLASEEGGEVTGRVFEAAGDWFAPADGWRSGPKAHNGGKRYEPAEVGAAMKDILSKVEPPQKVYGT